MPSIAGLQTEHLNKKLRNEHMLPFFDRIFGRRQESSEDREIPMHPVEDADQSDKFIRAREEARERENRLRDLEYELKLEQWERQHRRSH